MNPARTYVASSSLPVPVEDAFAYHDRPGALERLIPPWESVTIEHNDRSLAVGSRVVMKTSIFGVPVRWVAEHTQYDPPRRFVDRQLSGPFAAWEHHHEFEAAGEH
ncbi:MAG: SRPBCC family protein [Pirellulales bacterium]|nr:SRPBCC family protein [Pirellulales bacterium]